MMTPGPLDNFIARMPKAELHIHLEGSVRPATLLALAQRNNVSLPFANEAALREYYRFRDFNHFLAVYDLICDCIQTPDDLTLMTYELGASAAEQHIRYMEVTFTTCGRLRRGLSLDDQLAGVRVSESTMYCAQQRIGWTRKKSLIASERDETARAAFRAMSALWEATTLIFLDESGTQTNMTPRDSRAPRGERAHGSAPRNHEKNTTLVACLSLAGLGEAMTLAGRWMAMRSSPI